MKARAAGGDLDVALLAAQLERHLARRQAADDVGEQPARAAARCPAARPWRRRGCWSGPAPCRSRAGSASPRRRSAGCRPATAACRGSRRRVRRAAAPPERESRDTESFIEGRSSSYLDQMYLIRGWLGIVAGFGLAGRDAACGSRPRRRWIMPRLGGRIALGRLRPQADVDPVERLGGLGSGLEPARRPSGSRAGRWCGRDRSRGRSRPARAPVSSRARYIASWRERAIRGERRGESSSSLVRPLTAQTASWIAASVGASARRARSARPARGRGARSGSSAARESSEAIAITLVIAPSSTRTFSGTLVAISCSTRGSGSSGLGPGGDPPEHGDPGPQVGRLELDPQPPVEAVAEPLGELRERLRRAVAGEHDLLAGRVQGVEGVDELLLGALLALEHLDVVDQQRVELAIAGLERLRALAPQRRDELGREPLGGRVVDLELGVVAAQVLDDRAQQVGLAEARRAMEEERVVGLARELGDRQCRRVREPVARARSRTARRCGWGRAAATRAGVAAGLGAWRTAVGVEEGDLGQLGRLSRSDRADRRPGRSGARPRRGSPAARTETGSSPGAETARSGSNQRSKVERGKEASSSARTCRQSVARSSSGGCAGTDERPYIRAPAPARRPPRISRETKSPAACGRAA